MDANLVDRPFMWIDMKQSKSVERYFFSIVYSMYRNFDKKISESYWKLNLVDRPFKLIDKRLKALDLLYNFNFQLFIVYLKDIDFDKNII